MATLTPGQQGNVLFASQDAGRASIQSAAAGTPTAPAAWGVNLYSHNGTPYPLAQSQWDIGAETDLDVEPGSAWSTDNPYSYGSTAAVALTDGGVGVVINSADLSSNAGGAVPYGPMAFNPMWIPAAATTPFQDGSAQSLNVSLDLQVPYSEMPGEGSDISSNQIVLYLGLTDTTTGRNLAYGSALFDSRGMGWDYFGLDNGPGGTGAAVANMPAGEASPYETPVAGAASFQGALWSGWKTFDFQVTAANFEALISHFNAQGGNWSTNLSDYALTNVSVDGETEFFGQDNSMAYSVRNLDVTTGATVGSLGGYYGPAQLGCQTPDVRVAEGAYFASAPGASFWAPDSCGMYYTATLENGASLPSWMAFDNATGILSGTAPLATGVVGVVVSAFSNDGQGGSSEELHVYTSARAPVLAAQTGDVRTGPEQAFSVSVAGSFSDPDGGQLGYAVMSSDGSALPSWLHFDASTGVISGTAPSGGSNGAGVEVVATNSEGLQSAEAFHVYSPSSAPVLVHQAQDQRPAAGSDVSFALPAGSYSDPAGGTVSYSASQADGTALPGWLGFDAATDTFAGHVPDAAQPVLAIKVVASAQDGAVSAEAFHLYVQPVKPVFMAQTPDERLGASQAFSFALPPSTFSDPGGGTVSYAAHGTDMSAVPSWLSFNAADGVFSGTTPAGSGVLGIRIDATTPSGGTAAEAFHLYWSK